MNIENIQFNRSAVSPMECISKGWEILKPNYLMFFGVGLLALILGCIPVVSWFLIGPIMVGIYGALLVQYRGENADFGMMFSGFSKFFPAFIIGLLLLLPGIVINTYSLGLRIAQALAIFNPNELTAGAATIFALFGFLINIAALVASIIFGITFTFALPLLADKDLSLMDTIKLSARAGWSNFGGLFLLFLLLGLLMIGGTLALCIGLLFVLPMIYASLTVAYRQVFPGENTARGQHIPPSPDNFKGSYGQPV